MEEIKAYKTSDGRVFIIKEEAEKEEKLIVAKKEISNFLENYYYRGMEEFDIINMLIENKKKLLEILNF